MVTGCGILGSDCCGSRREDVKDLLLIGLLIINFFIFFSRVDLLMLPSM